MIGQVYPGATSLLHQAFDLLDDLRRRWERHIGDGPSEVVITTDRDGAGRITVRASWQPGDREALTAELRRLVATLWACLDSVIIETVEMFCTLERIERPDRERFFPMADSDDNLDALLEESCLDGVLATHGQIVRDCQPYQGSPDHPEPAALRAALRDLLSWDEQLQSGDLVDAWVTPISPAVSTEPPGAVTDLETAEPGPVEDGRVVARYRITRLDCSVEGQAGSYVDFCLPGGFAPESADDTFDRRLTRSVRAVVRLAALFTRETAAVRGIKAMTRVARGTPPVETWTPAENSRRAWSNEELVELAKQSDIGLGVVRGAEELTLLVTTEHGVYERVVPAASPLNPYVDRGKAAEDAAHSAAATWGLPDFVFLPSAEHQGSRNREISDGLIVTGNEGIVLQIKSRATAIRPNGDAAWIDKKVEQAVRQVDGTIRRLRDHPAELMNGRGRSVTLVGSDIAWVGVVLLDHPDPPYGHEVATTRGGRNPIVVLLRRDWEFLFAQLRSTRAVVDYLHRVDGSSRLGAEPERYFELARADEVTEPTPIAVRGPGEHRSVPRLPVAPAGSDDDQAHGMVRIMCEDIATSPHSGDERDRLRLLATIDSLPIGYRTELGWLLIDALAEARRTPEETTRWKFRTFRAELGQPQLGFGVCSRLDDVTRDAFRSWVLLRHHERAEHVDELADSLSLGVLLTPRRDGLRDWDTTMLAIEGDPYLTEEQLESWRHLWNTADSTRSEPDGGPARR